MTDQDPFTLTRRHAIGAAGAAGAALVLANVTGPGRLLESIGVEDAQAATSCVLTPDKTEGPYFVDEKLNRSDIRSDPSDGTTQAGVPLELTFVIVRADGECAPVANATVDIWHCNSQGSYSDVAQNGTSGKKFLRGLQVTDSQGQVKFTTVYPGWYQGRAVHIHFKVRLFDGSNETHEFTSQIFFDPAVSAEVYKSSAYRSHGSPDTSNSSDGIYGSDGEKLLVPLSAKGDGYAGTFVVGLDGLPASSGSGGDATDAVAAAFTSASFKRTVTGGRTLRVKVTGTEAVTATARLTRSGQSIARKRAALSAGTRVMNVKIPRRTTAGAATLVLRLVNDADESKTATKTVRVPKRLSG